MTKPIYLFNRSIYDQLTEHSSSCTLFYVTEKAEGERLATQAREEWHSIIGIKNPADEINSPEEATEWGPEEWEAFDTKVFEAENEWMARLKAMLTVDPEAPVGPDLVSVHYSVIECQPGPVLKIDTGINAAV